MSVIYNGVMGLVLGDALGVPYEFRKRGTFRITGMAGYGTHNQPMGTWSDDSSMVLATLDSLNVFGGRIDLDDIMSNFVRWYHEEGFTPHGSVFDMGGTTASAIVRYSQGLSVDECGFDDGYSDGNGSLMRVLPLAFVNATDYEVGKVSALTHASYNAVCGCQIYVRIVKNLIEGMSPKEAIKKAMQGFSEAKEYQRIPRIWKYEEKDILSGGYVVNSLEAALWALTTTNSYLDCVYKAINLGNDTDTIGAIAGGMAGIVYGIGGKKGIPKKMIRRVAKKGEIRELCKEADSKFRKNMTKCKQKD